MGHLFIGRYWYKNNHYRRPFQLDQNRMEQLDKILVARHVDLDIEEPQPKQPNRQERAESRRRSEKLTESLLRNDVVAPTVVKFTPTYNPYKKCQRWSALLSVVFISTFGIVHFSKVLVSFSHEATLDIETKMKTIGQLENTSSVSVSNSTFP